MDELSKVLVDIIKKAEGGIEKGIDFAQQQVPDVVHQLLMWNFTFSLIWFTFGLILFGIFVYQVRRMFINIKLHEANKHLGYDDRAGGWALTAVPVGALAWGFIACNLDWLQILIAPKLYLIEYAAHLMKAH